MKIWDDIVQRECRASDLTVRTWCADNGVIVKTDYYRLRRKQECICDNNIADINSDH